MRLYLLVFSLLLFASACSKRVVDTASADKVKPAKKLRVAQVLQAIADNSATTEWLDAKARVKLESEQLNIGGTATIRLHRDKAIWMSVKKFGFEGARALIRPDSFFLYNRLNNEYTAEPLSYIEEKYKIPARFDLLQEVVMGNPVFFTDDLRLQADGNNLRLSGHDERFVTDYRIMAGTYRLSAMELQEVDQNRKLLVTNEDYQEVSGLAQPFAFVRDVAVDGGSAGKARMEMSFSSVAVGQPVSMPFSKK